MWPPWEWLDREGLADGSVVWHMLQVLYGRGSAGETFRLLHEAIILSVPGFDFIILHYEPCMYFSQKRQCLVAHHVDDGRLAGSSSEDVSEVIAWMAKFLLLKVSNEIGLYDGYKYLNRIRVRLEDGWATLVDPKLMDKVNKILQLPAGCKVAASPSVKRGTGDTTHRIELSQKEYRSVVGVFIHLSLDIELIAFAVKELARRLNDPQPADWCAAVRLARWMSNKSGYATVQRVKGAGDEVQVLAWTDSDWAGLEDCRSTSGNHLELDGFKVYHSSVTQPGLPALSSPEAETRSLARGGCLGLQLKLLVSELAKEVKLTLKCDAQAAIDGAQKLSGSRLRHLEISQTYTRKLLRGKHAQIQKVGGQFNVSDCLTKHLSPEDTKAHLGMTGFQPFDHEWRLVTMRRINTTDDLQDPSELVQKNEQRKRALEIADGLELAKGFVSEDLSSLPLRSGTEEP